mgnify:CR=1 FL=1
MSDQESIDTPEAEDQGNTEAEIMAAILQEERRDYIALMATLSSKLRMYRQSVHGLWRDSLSGPVNHQDLVALINVLDGDVALMENEYTLWCEKTGIDEETGQDLH